MMKSIGPHHRDLFFMFLFGWKLYPFINVVTLLSDLK